MPHRSARRRYEELVAAARRARAARRVDAPKPRGEESAGRRRARIDGAAAKEPVEARQAALTAPAAAATPALAEPAREDTAVAAPAAAAPAPVTAETATTRAPSDTPTGEGVVPALIRAFIRTPEQRDLLIKLMSSADTASKLFDFAKDGRSASDSNGDNMHKKLVALGASGDELPRPAQLKTLAEAAKLFAQANET